MSFVSVIAMQQFITVMSDGLVVDLETGEEIERRYKKIKMISDNQFIAFGGDKGLTEHIVNIIGYQQGQRNLYEISNIIRNQIIDEISPETGSCQIIIGGVENGEIVFYSFNNDKEQGLLIKKPKGKNGEYSFLSSSKIALDLDREIEGIYAKYGSNTPTKALKIQKELNDVVAKNDSSVNRITFGLTIRK